MDKNSSMAGFAALLDQQFKGFRKGFNQGDTVNARVVRVGEEYVTLDVNAKTVGLLPVADVTDEEGEVTVKRGDTVEVSFVSMQKDAYLFAKADVAVSAAVVSVDQTIQRAFDGGLPLDGTVETLPPACVERLAPGVLKLHRVPLRDTPLFLLDGTPWETGLSPIFT